MSKFTDDMETILGSPNYHAQCMQIAPFGQDRCAMLFEVGTQDHELAWSVVFEVAHFDPNNARQIQKIPEWWTSLTSPSPSNLFALEVGRPVYRYRDGAWTSETFAQILMQRVWSYSDGLSLLVGDDGESWEFNGANWTALRPDRPRRLRDVHGPSRDLVHCVGRFGTLQRLVGAGWRSIDLPVEADLWGVHVSPDGTVRACGDNGTCLRIVDEEMITLDAPPNTFFAVHQFQGETYWGDSAYGIYREEGDALVEFHPTGTGWDMRADTDFLYAVGGGSAWRFDGRKWNALHLDYDGDFRLIQ